MSNKRSIYLVGHYETSRYSRRTTRTKFPDAIKIGIAADVEERVSNMQSGTPNVLETITTIDSDNPKEVEQELHSIYKGHQITGEWFNVVYNIVNSMKALSRLDYSTAKTVRRYRKRRFDDYGRYESLYIHTMKARRGEIEVDSL